VAALLLGPDGPRIGIAEATDRPGEATIALRLGGVCATDLELCKGYMGFTGVLGHEFVGEVVDHPESAWIGRRVVGDINASCGGCPTCLAGRPTHCPSRTVLGILGRDGAFQHRFQLPAGNLHVVPDGVSDEAAVFVEPLAAALEILEQVHVRPTDRVVVLGLGRLGQLCARVLALTGAQVSGVGRGGRGVDRLPQGISGVSLEQADALADADLVVDCTGHKDGLALATRLLRPRGTLVLKTTVHDTGAVPVTPWVIDELRIVGSRCGPFAPALRLLAAGVVDPTPLIDGERPLSGGVEALEDAARTGVIKVVLRP